MRRRPAKLAATGIVLASVAAVAHPARARMMVEPDFAPAPPTFELQGPALGEAGAPDVSPAHLAGSTIAALDRGALALDADSGQLVRLDDRGAATARLDIGRDAAQLVYDATAKRAYVSDRLGDRVVVVEVGKKLVEKARWKTPVEPWGLALSPDGKTLLVTTVADRTLLALDTATGEPRWQTGLSREPRGVAFSPDGASALVGYLTTGTVERFDLDTRKGLHVALGAGRSAQARVDQRPVTGFVAAEAPARSFARAAFAVRYLGHDLAIVGFQQSTPVQIAGGGENAGSYGGGFEPPIEHRVAFLAGARGIETPTVDARIAAHQPDAIGWDAATDRLVIAGLGSDDLIVVTDASQPSVKLERQIALTAEGACAPTGVAVTADTAWVWCSASRRAARVDVSTGAVAFGKPATRSRRTELEQEGYALFRIGNDLRISTRGAMACSSCHPDHRTDGLSWRIEGHELQTPLLAGRVEGTHPYKWDGGDKDLTTSLGSTMRRLGGSGLGDRQVKALAAFLESLPAPRAPARDRAGLARQAPLRVRRARLRHLPRRLEEDRSRHPRARRDAREGRHPVADRRRRQRALLPRRQRRDARGAPSRRRARARHGRRRRPRREADRRPRRVPRDAVEGTRPRTSDFGPRLRIPDPDPDFGSGKLTSEVRGLSSLSVLHRRDHRPRRRAG